MANLNSEVVFASPSYVCGEKKDCPHALASPQWAGPKRRVRSIRVNGPLKSNPCLVGARLPFAVLFFLVT